MFRKVLAVVALTSALVLPGVASGAEPISVLSTSGPSSPYNGKVQIRASEIVLKMPFSGSSPDVRCGGTEPLGMVGTLGVGGMYANGTLSYFRRDEKMIFGRLLKPTSTESTNCQAEPFSNLGACRVSQEQSSQPQSQMPILIQDTTLAGTRTLLLSFGVTAGPMRISIVCRYLDDGEETLPCVYTARAAPNSSTGGPVLATAPFSTTAPIRAGGFGISNQPFKLVNEAYPKGSENYCHSLFFPTTTVMNGKFELYSIGTSPQRLYFWDKPAA